MFKRLMPFVFVMVLGVGASQSDAQAQMNFKVDVADIILDDTIGVDLLFGGKGSFVFGPTGTYYIGSLGSGWSGGLRGEWFLNGKAFTSSFQFMLLGSYGSASLTGGAGFSVINGAAMLGYDWFMGKSFNAQFGVGAGYAKVTGTGTTPSFALDGFGLALEAKFGFVF